MTAYDPAQIRKQALSHFIRYIIAGTIAVSVQFSVLTTAVELFNILPILGSALGFMGGASTNYVLQYYFTFKSKGNHFYTLLKFLGVNSVTLCINLAIFSCLTDLLNIWYVASQAVAIIVVVFINFYANRRWTFT